MFCVYQSTEYRSFHLYNAHRCACAYVNLAFLFLGAQLHYVPTTIEEARI